MKKSKRRKSTKLFSKSNKKKGSKFSLSTSMLNAGIAGMTIILISFIFSFSNKQMQTGSKVDVQFPPMSVSKSPEEIYEANPLLDINIEILNGCGEPGLAAKFSDLLREKRIDVVRSENANHFEYDNTILIQRTEKVNGMKIVADALSLDINNKKQVITLVDPNLDVDLTLIIGKDYRNIPSIRPYIRN